MSAPLHDDIALSFAADVLGEALGKLCVAAYAMRRSQRETGQRLIDLASDVIEGLPEALRMEILASLDMRLESLEGVRAEAMS